MWSSAAPLALPAPLHTPLPPTGRTPPHHHVNAPPQARAAAGCRVRYLGASTDCGAITTGLYGLDDQPAALLQWQLIRV